MKDLSTLTASPGSIASWDDIAGLQARLVEAVETMQAMADEVGMARHIQNYDSDRRKRALARAMAPALAGGDSAAKAEAEARASENYAKELNQLGKEYTAAEQTCAQWDVAKIKWESARSLLTMMRETVKHF